MKMIKKILFTGWLLGLASIAGFAQSICTEIPSAPTRIPAGGVISDAPTLTLTAGNWLISTKTPSIVVGTIDATGLKSAANLYIQSGQQLNLSTIVAGSTLNIIVMPGGFLTFAQKVILSPNVSIYNYGNVNALGDFTLNGKFFNAIYSELDASKFTLLISGEGNMVNNGVVLLNDLKIESSITPVICIGVNSCIVTNTFSQNTVTNSVQPNFASTTSFGNITINGTITDIRNGITFSSSVKVFLAKNTIPSNWGKATIEEGVSSPFCTKGLKELVDPNPASSQIICEGAVPNPIKYLPATGGDGVNYFYQWQSSTDAKTWGNVKGNPEDYAPPALKATTYFRRIVTSVFTVTSNIHTVRVLPSFNPINNTISSGGAIYCGIGQVDITGSDVASVEELGNFGVTYDWLSSVSKSDPWTSLKNSSPNFSVKDLLSTTYYRRTVASNGRCNIDTSEVVEVGVGDRFVVTNTKDNMEVPTCGMLRFALNAANELPDLNEITFKLPNSPNSILLEGGLTISSNVKIVGPGKKLLAIDGNGRSNIFNFYSRQVTTARLEAVDTITTISGLTLKGATGGALNFNSAASSLVLKKCDFVSNTSSSGAGLNFTGVNLVIDTCTFNGNNIITHPQTGFVGNGAGANIQASGNVLMRNSLFLNNLGANNGGGVYLSGSFTDAKVLYSSFVKNSANNGGGMAVDLNTSGKVNVMFSTFSGNNSTIGGGIYSNSDFTLSNSSLSENSAKSTGGGVEVMTGAFSFIDNIIAGNISSVSNGRDLHLYKGTASSKGYNFIGVSNDMTGDVPTWDKTNDILGTATAPISSKLFPLDPVSYTYSPIIGSPVIGKGATYSGIPSTDQLGNSTKLVPFNIGSVSFGPIYKPPFGFSTCSNIDTLNATSPPGYTGQWRTTSTSIKITDSKNPTTDIIFPSTTKADTAILIWDLYSDINTKTPAISTTIKVIRKEIPDAPSVTTPVYECLGVEAKNLTIFKQTITDTLLWYSPDFPKGTSATIKPLTTNIDSLPYTVSRVVKGCESAKATIYVSTKAQPNTKLIVVDTVFCSNTTKSAVSITSSEKGFSYGAYKGQIQIGKAQGTGLKLSIPISNLPVGDTIINFKVSNTGCSNIPLTNTAKVTVNKMPSAKPIVTTTSPVCEGSQTSMDISLAEKNVKYSIYDGTVMIDNLVGTGVAVSKKQLTMKTAGARTLSLQASIAGCATVNIADTPGVFVNAIPTSALAITASSPVCLGGNSTLSFTGEFGVKYLITNNKNTVTATGTGKPFTASIPMYTAGANIIAIQAISGACTAVDMTTKPAVTVNDTANTKLTVSATSPICVGGTSTITFNKSQLNVKYYILSAGVKIDSAIGTGSDLIKNVAFAKGGIYSLTFQASVPNCAIVNLVNKATVIVNNIPTNTLAITATSPVCLGGASSLSFTGEFGVNYQIFNNGKSVNTITGTGKPLIQSILMNAAGSNLITMQAVSGVCTPVTMTNSPTVIVNDTANTKLLVSATSPICVGGTSAITISKSQLNVKYYITNFGVKIDSIVGTGVDISKAISFTKSGTNNLTFQASVPACKVVNLANTTKVDVNAGPDLNLSVTGDAAICINSSAKLAVNASQIGVNYQVFEGTVAVSGTQIGIGNSLIFNIPALNVGKHLLSVKATVPGCGTVNLTQTLTVTVNPLPSIISSKNKLSVCIGDVINLKAATLANGTYQWTDLKQFRSTLQNPTIATTNAIAGIYNYYVTYSLNGCIGATDTTEVTINNLPVANLKYVATSFCENDANILPTSTNRGTIKYYSTPAGLSLNNLTGEVTFATSKVDTYIITDTVSNTAGCKAGASFSLTINARPAKPVINYACVATGSNVNLSTQYSGNTEQYAHKWFLNADSIANTSIYTAVKSGTYKVLVKYNNKCISDTSNGVNPFNNASKINITYGKTPFCAGDSIKLSSIALKGNSWRLGNGKIDTAKTVTVKTGGKMVLTISGGNCPGKDSLDLTVTPLPSKPTITGADSMCVGQTVLLSTTSANGLQWISKNGTIGTGATLTVSDTGTYRVKITSNNCSNTSDPKAIRFKKMPAKPILNTTGSQTLCQGNTLPISIQNFLNGQDQWYLSKVAVAGTVGKLQTLSATTSGIYKVIRTSGGCAAVSDSVSLTVNPCTVLTYAGKDTTICTNTFKMEAIASPNNQTAWRVLSGRATFVDSTTSNTTASNFASGLNKLVWLIKSNGKIVGSDTVLITNNSVSKANAGNDLNICVDSTVLNGSKPLVGEIGQWINLSEASILNPDAYNSKVKRLLPISTFYSTNTFVWTISKGVCVSTDTVDITLSTVVITVKDTIKGVAGQFVDVPVTLNDKYALGDKLKVSGKWPKGGAIDTAYVVGDTLLRFKTNSKKYLKNYSINYILSNQCPSGRDTGVVILNSVNKAPLANVNQTVRVTSGSDTLVSFGSILYDANPNLDSLRLLPNTNRGVLKLSFNADSTKIQFSISYKTNPTFVGTETFQFVVGDKNENGIRSFATSAILVTVEEAPSTIAKAGLDQTICADTATLGANPAPVGMSGRWSVIKGKASFVDAISAKTKVLALASDTNQLVWTLFQNNIVISKDTVIIINKKTLANAGLDRKVFVGTINLIGNTGTTPAWRKIPNTTIISRDSSFNASLSVGLNTFEYSLSGSNCTSRDSVRITYVIKDTARAGNDIYACVDTSILKATKPKTANRGKWTFVGKNSGALTIANDTLFNSKISGISAGNGVLLWTVTSLIDSTTRSVDTLKIFNAKVTVTITKPTSAPDIALTQKTISLADTVVSAFPITTTWYRNDTLQAIVPSTFTKNVTVFKVKVANKYCGASDSLTATLVDTTKAYAGPNQEIYIDSTLSGALKPANEYKGTWSKETNSPIVIVDKNVYNTKFKNIPFGTSKLVWTLVSPNAITTRDTLVIVRKKLTVEAVVTQPVCTQANGTISIQIKELSNYLDTFVGDTLKGATTKGLSPKSYKVRIFRNGKPVKDTSFVLKAVNPYKLTLSSKDTSFCSGLSLTIKGKITPSIFATYKWSGPKISSADSVIVSDSGKYVLTTTASGCVLKDSVKVRLFPSPKAFAGNDTLTCQSTAKLNAGSLKQGEKGTWSKLFGTSILSATNIPNPTVTFLSKYDSTKGKETNRFVWSVSDQNQRCTTHDTVDVYYAVVLISVQDDTSGIAGQEIALKVTQNDKYALGDKLEVAPLNTKIGAGQPILAYDVQDLTVVFKTNPRFYVKEPYRFGYIISNNCQARDTGYVVLNKTTNDPPTAKTFTKSTESGSVYTFVLNFSEVDKNPNISKAKVERSLHGLPTATFSGSATKVGDC